MTARKVRLTNSDEQKEEEGIRFERPKVNGERATRTESEINGALFSPLTERELKSPTPPGGWRATPLLR
jgi:hypothetical protein